MQYSFRQGRTQDFFQRAVIKLDAGVVSGCWLGMVKCCEAAPDLKNPLGLRKSFFSFSKIKVVSIFHTWGRFIFVIDQPLWQARKQKKKKKNRKPSSPNHTAHIPFFHKANGGGGGGGCLNPPNTPAYMPVPRPTCIHNLWPDLLLPLI